MADDADLLVGLGAAHRRGQRPRRRGPHQGEDLRDDHPRHGGAGLPRGGARHTARPGRSARCSPTSSTPTPASTRGAANYNLMVRHLHDIAGGAVVTAPSIADLENPDTGPLMQKYMATRHERRRRVPHPAVPRDPRPHRRHLRRLAGRHQHPGRRRAVRPAHRHPQALRPRPRQGHGAGRSRPDSRALRATEPRPPSAVGGGRDRRPHSPSVS